MEVQSSSIRSEIDTTRPFRSVREAVAIFAQSQKTNAPSFSSSSSSSSNFNQDRELEELMILSSIRKLEAEMEETKQELKLLKEREFERDVLVSLLNSEVHNNMTKLTEIESAKRSLTIEEEEEEEEEEEDERVDFEYLPSLAKFGEKEKIKALKRKPIVPLVGDIFFKKKKPILTTSSIPNGLAKI